MAHITLRPADAGGWQLIINGHDFSREVFRDVQLVEVIGDDGDPAYAEVGFQVTFAVSRIDLGGDQDVQVTDHFPQVAQRVRTLVEEA